MVQNSLILINFLGVFILQLFLGDGVSVSHTIPQNVEANKETQFEINFTKGAAEGFAKLQMDFTQDVKVKAVDVKGASFSYDNNSLKLIWMSVPNEEEFSVKLSMTPSAEGSVFVEGKFSYLENNNRVDIRVDKKTFTVGAVGDAVADQTEEEEEVEIDADTGEDVTDDGEDEVETQDAIADASDETDDAQEEVTQPEPKKQASAVSVKRTIMPAGEGAFIVHLDVEKGNNTDFARVEDVLPKGVKAQGVVTKNATFNFVDNKAKFVWMALPNEPNFRITYKITVTTATPGNYNIMGDFSYILDGETNKYTIDASVLKVEDTAPALADDATNDDATDNTDGGQEKKQDTPPPPPPTDDVTDTPAPQKGIAYRVQIAAGKKNVAQDYFSKTHEFNENVIIENHEGWIKYTTGKYDVYRQARDKREAVVGAGYDFDGPFVTAYNDGTRITVQEALMITNQQWLP